MNKYNSQLNSPQLAYNINMKKYYLSVINKNNENNKKIINTRIYFQTGYDRIYVPSQSITY